MTRNSRPIVGPKEQNAPELKASDVTTGIMVQSGEEIHVTLKVELADDPTYSGFNVDTFVIDLGGKDGVNPYALAAELMAAGDALVRLSAQKYGVDHQEEEKRIRKLRRKAGLKRHQIAEEIVAASHCHACPRPVRFVVDGVPYCGRHAEEAGVRPRGKIGGEL